MWETQPGEGHVCWPAWAAVEPEAALAVAQPLAAADRRGDQGSGKPAEDDGLDRFGSLFKADATKPGG